MANPFYTPNLVAGMPGSETAFSGESIHPGLLTAPALDETLSSGRPGFAGALIMPPRIVVATVYAKTWRLNCSLSGSGATLTHTDTDLAGLWTNWNEALTTGGQSLSFSEYAYDGGDPANWVQLAFAIGGPGRWAWSTGEWWPGLSVTINSRTFPDEEGAGGALGGGGIGGTSYSGSAMGVTLEVCGEIIPVYYNGDSLPVITGTVTLEPVDWLAVG